MITDREELENILEKMISAYAKDRKVVQKVTKELNKRNVLDGDVLSIFKLNTPISSLSLSFLYCFTQELFDATQEHKLDPEKHFTQLEIETADKWSQEVKTEEDKYPVVFKNVIKIQDNVWLTKLSAQELVDMFSKRILTYNPETQRPLKRKEFNDKIIERIDVNPKAVKKIKDLILKNNFIPNCITINVLEDSDAQIEEDLKEQSVIVYSGSINLTDGYHRFRGLVKALLENPNLEYTTGVLLTYFDVEKAKDYIFQEQQHNPINYEYTKSINPDKISNQVVVKINEKKDSLLRGKITKDSIMLKTGQALVLHNILSDAIDLTFNPTDNKEALKVSYAVISGLNTIIELNDKLLDEPVNFKYWVVYICLIFCVYNGKYDDNDTEEIIQEALLRIDMNKIELKTITKLSIRNINSYLSIILSNIAEGKD